MVSVCRDALIVVIGNSMTSVVAGLAVFSVLGHLAHHLHTTVNTVTQGGDYNS